MLGLTVVRLFIALMPRGGNLHRFVDTELEPYVGVALTRASRSPSQWFSPACSIYWANRKMSRQETRDLDRHRTRLPDCNRSRGRSRARRDLVGGAGHAPASIGSLQSSGEVQAFAYLDREHALAQARAPTSAAQQGRRSARCTAFRSASRTSSNCGHADRVRLAAACRAAAASRTRRWSRNCARPAP